MRIRQLVVRVVPRGLESRAFVFQVSVNKPLLLRGHAQRPFLYPPSKCNARSFRTGKHGLFVGLFLLIGRSLLAYLDARASRRRRSQQRSRPRRWRIAASNFEFRCSCCARCVYTGRKCSASETRRRIHACHMRRRIHGEQEGRGARPRALLALPQAPSAPRLAAGPVVGLFSSVVCLFSSEAGLVSSEIGLFSSVAGLFSPE